MVVPGRNVKTQCLEVAGSFQGAVFFCHLKRNVGRFLFVDTNSASIFLPGHQGSG